MRTILSKGKIVFDKPVIVVGGITLFGALIRLYHLGFKPLWLDEAVLYWIANSGSLGSIITQNALHNSAPPLFAILLSIMLKIGNSEMVLRSLPWLGGVASIPAMYFLARQFFEREPAYLATLIVAVAETQIQYSQELREYSLSFLAATIMLALFYKHVRQPSRVNLALMTLAMVLSIFLQYGLALLIIALNLIYAVELLFSKGRRKLLFLEWCVSQFIVLGAVALVYYLSLRRQMIVGFGATSITGYLADAYWNGSISSLFRLAVINMYDIFDFALHGGILLFTAGVVFVLTLREQHGYRALIMFAIPMILTFIAALARLYPYQGARQDMFLIPIIYVLIGFSFSHLLHLFQRRWVGSLLLLAVISIELGLTGDSLNDPGQENIRPVIATLSESFKGGDEIYVYYAAKPAFTYYYHEHMDSQVYGTSSRENPDRYLQEIDNLLLSDNRIWLVFSHCYADECEMISDYVSERRQVESLVTESDAWLYLAH